MDESIIQIDDSIISVPSDTDIEDGEVKEADESSNEVVEVSFKPPPAAPPKPPSPARERNHQVQAQPSPREPPQVQKQEASAADNLIFEVTFSSTEDYSKLSSSLLEMLNRTFTDGKFVFSADETKSRISAYRKPASPPPVMELFQIDTAPATKLNAALVPSYKRCRSDVLDEETHNRKKLKAEAANKCSRPKIQSACFNCGDTDHSLRECTRPRNQNRIQRARKKTSRVERYHVDTEQRFAHIRPGKISSKTRHAMGFSRGELPFIFYRLRVLGYPPAWLEEAKVQGSGIALFNADGTEVQGPEEEEGEADSFKYDINKIVDFPGFNVEPGPKFYDDYQHHNVPRFQESQLKANFIKSLGDNVTKGYKRKKLIELPTPHDVDPARIVDTTNYVEHDMEVEDGNSMDATLQPPLPIETNPAAPPPPPDSDTASQRSASPTLEDLKAQQAQLLQQLESPNTSLNASNLSAAESPVAPTEMEAQPKSLSAPALFKGPSIEGTPLLKFSVYDKLPHGEKFKAGVSDVINFENLPDSTGKYEKMKGLLKDVRVKMETLQNSDD
ncbi:hypothetical protein KR222_011256 [Zaprionus bogoriensis]|nr:hypothetical protein KR222_011256 [Zaprionus bogoriensis]